MKRILGVAALAVLALGLGVWWSQGSTDGPDAATPAPIAEAVPAQAEADPATEPPAHADRGAAQRPAGAPPRPEPTARSHSAETQRPDLASRTVPSSTTERERRTGPTSPGGGGTGAAPARPGSAEATALTATDAAGESLPLPRRVRDEAPRSGIDEASVEFLARRGLGDDPDPTLLNERRDLARGLLRNESPEVLENVRRRAEAAGY